MLSQLSLLTQIRKIPYATEGEEEEDLENKIDEEKSEEKDIKQNNHKSKIKINKRKLSYSSDDIDISMF